MRSANSFQLIGHIKFSDFLFVLYLFFSLELSIVAWNQELSEAEKEKKFKTLKEETIPLYLGKLEEIAKENNGHSALKRPTWADVYFTSMSEYFCFMSKQDLLAKYPNLKKVTENVYAFEGIKKWIAKRPKNVV